MSIKYKYLIICMYFPLYIFPYNGMVNIGCNSLATKHSGFYFRNIIYFCSFSLIPTALVQSLILCSL